MKPELQAKLSLFAANAQAAKKEFFFRHHMTRRLAALLYAQEGKPIDIEAIRQCHALIKSRTGVFSMFRGNLTLCVAALLSLSDHPKRLVDDMIDVYKMLKGVKMRASDYLAMAAYCIASGTDSKNFENAVQRTRAFYDGMRSNNWFLTGRDDYIFAAMLGLSDLDVGVATGRMREMYLRLKGDFWVKNSVQALTQVLVLGGSSDEAVERVLALRDLFRTERLRLDRAYTLPLLGILALLPEDVGQLTDDLRAAQTFLRTQKGFSLCAKQERLMYAAAVVASSNMDGAKQGVLNATLSTSITNIIIAQQVAMIAAMSAASHAATTSSSS